MKEKTPHNIKRLFFGFEVHGSLDLRHLKGRMLLPEDHHTTLAFLGSIDIESIQDIPLPPWKIGPAATATHPLFLPRCIALAFELQESSKEFLTYQETLASFLVHAGLLKKKDHFLPHVTLCRPPFNRQEWSDFTKIPLSIGSLHLYESLGQSRYKKIWTHPIELPYEEIPHTADIAFIIRGESLQALALHAYLALASKAPALLKFNFDFNNQSHEDLIASLNATLTKLDIEEGSPLKAVSYHGDIHTTSDGLLKWEMIIDV